MCTTVVHRCLEAPTEVDVMCCEKVVRVGKNWGVFWCLGASVRNEASEPFLSYIQGSYRSLYAYRTRKDTAANA